MAEQPCFVEVERTWPFHDITCEGYLPAIGRGPCARSAGPFFQFFVLGLRELHRDRFFLELFFIDFLDRVHFFWFEKFFKDFFGLPKKQGWAGAAGAGVPCPLLAMGTDKDHMSFFELSLT